MDFFELKDNFSKYKHIKSNLIKGNETMKAPLVSIVIPTYHRVDTLKVAIDSALNQKDFDDYVVIVVDNEPRRNCETEKLIQHYNNEKLYYYKNEGNLGMVGNWNRCVELCDSEWVTLLHDDDVLLPEFLYSMFSILGKNSDIEFLVSKGFVCNSDSLKKIYEQNLIINQDKKVEKIKTNEFVSGNIASAPGVVMKKSILMGIGGYNGDHYPIQDYSLWLNYHLKYNSYRLNDFLWIYRFDDNNTSKSVAYDIVVKSAELKVALAKKIRLNPIIFFVKLRITQIYLINGYRRYFSDEEYEELMFKYGTKNNAVIFFYRVINKIYNMYNSYRFFSN